NVDRLDLVVQLEVAAVVGQLPLELLAEERDALLPSGAARDHVAGQRVPAGEHRDRTASIGTEPFGHRVPVHDDRSLLHLLGEAFRGEADGRSRNLLEGALRNETELL